MRKTEFSKKWLIGCIVFSAGVTVTSYILAGLDKNPVSELSIAVIEACWGASGVSFVGYAIQNSVRAFTSSKFGIPKEELDPEKKPGGNLRDELEQLLERSKENDRR